MMVRNYAKQTGGLFIRTAGKIAAMTVLQYINFCNHRKIGLVKDAFILIPTNGFLQSRFLLFVFIGEL